MHDDDDPPPHPQGRGAAVTFGSLFAGIGGFDLGLERAGMTVRWQVEVDDYCKQVLARHWPDVPRRGDIRLVDPADLEPVELLCGGFPCQDLSHAGRRAGLAGRRSGLWREFARILEYIVPRWVVIENVHHAWRSWVPSVRSDLHRRRYASLPLRVSAAQLGADHERRRVFLVAHPDGERLRDLARWWSWPSGEVAAVPRDPRWGSAASRVARGTDGVTAGVERRRALGNAVVPQVAELIGRAILAVEG